MRRRLRYAATFGLLIGILASGCSKEEVRSVAPAETPGLVIYTDTSAGFSITYPEDWVARTEISEFAKQEGRLAGSGTGFALLGGLPSDDNLKFDLVLLIFRIGYEDYPADFDDWPEYLRSVLPDGVEILSSTTTEIGGRDAFVTELNVRPQFAEITWNKTIESFVTDRGKLWKVTCVVRTALWMDGTTIEKKLQTCNSVVRSLNVLG